MAGMKTMRGWYSAIVAAAVMTACVPAQPPAASGKALTLDDAMAADRAFAASIAAEGPKAGFLKHFDTGGQFLEPGLVSKGLASVAGGFDGTPPGFTIAWTPDSGQDSANGDLAVTTGRYAVTLDGATIDAGQYFSVWRQGADGLKVVMQGRLPDPPAGDVSPDADAAR